MRKTEGAAIPAEAAPIGSEPAGTVDDALDALDMARELREGPELDAAGEEPGADGNVAAKPRRGRPRGSRSRRTAGTREEVRARLKETKADLEAAERELGELRAAAAARAAEANAEFEAETAGLLELAISATCVTYFHKKAERDGPHWELSEQETALLVGAWTRAAKPYFDQYLGRSPWGAALGVTVYVFASKRMQNPTKPPGEPVAVMNADAAEEKPAGGA